MKHMLFFKSQQAKKNARFFFFLALKRLSSLCAVASGDS
jgi:hypothetical protein